MLTLIVKKPVVDGPLLGELLLALAAWGLGVTVTTEDDSILINVYERAMKNPGAGMTSGVFLKDEK